MNNARYFPIIPAKIPRHKILKRLGYNSRKNEIKQSLLLEIDQWISQTVDLIQLKAMTLRAEIRVDPQRGEVDLSKHNLLIKSKKLSAFLKDSSEILLMGITGGTEIASEINKLQAENKMTMAVVIDAAASEIVDQGFDWITAFFNKELMRESKTLTKRRFSAGYGDLDLSYQFNIAKLLQLNKIDVKITESAILIPEKSVTAFCGIL